MLPSELAQLQRLGINPTNATREQLLQVILKLDSELLELGKTISLPRPFGAGGNPNRGEPNRG